MSDQTTIGIRIQVESRFIEERSDPSQNYYFFAYHVRISNGGSEASQLISRKWVITDSDGHVESVEGPGVVGEQPLLEAGETFEYTSFCPLRTAVGSMQGSYQMVLRSGEKFDAVIAPFTLAVPGTVN